MNSGLYNLKKETVLSWLENAERHFPTISIGIEIISNTEECLYIILDFGKCVAAIVVAEKTTGAPYNGVCFEAADIVCGVKKIIYSWYDKDDTTIEETIENLNNAVNFVWKYHNRVYVDGDH